MNHARHMLLVVTWMLAATSSLSGQLPTKLPEIKPFGIDGFRLMLQQQGLETMQAGVGAALEDSPQDTVVVMLGDLRLVPRFNRQINRFVTNGGSLLVAADLRGVHVKPTHICGVWVKHTRNARREHAYRGFSDCPVVTDLAEDVPNLFEGVETIVTNRPGELTFNQFDARSSRIRRVAWLPTRGRRERPVLMCVYGNGQGRMLFVADHSILTNQMLIHGDNARFAKNVTDWLCADGKRRQLVAIHNGRILPAWGLGDTPPPIPLNSLLRAVQRGGLEDLPIGDSVLPVLNASIADYQQKNELNNYLRRISSRLFGRRPFRIVLILLTVFVGLWLLRSLLGTRSRPRRWLAFQDWTLPIEPKLVSAGHEKQYRPRIRSLAREFFVESGLQTWDTAPQVHSETSAIRSKAKRDVRKVWNLATAPSRRRISKRIFLRTVNMIKHLHELQRMGELSLEWSGVASNSLHPSAEQARMRQSIQPPTLSVRASDGEV